MSAPCPGPASSPISTPPSIQLALATSLTQKSSAAADELISAVTTKVLQWITQALEQALAYQTTLATKVLAPITSSLGQVEQTQAGIQSKISTSVQGALAAAAGGITGGGTATSGVQPGTYKYNLWQDINAPASIAVTQGQAPPSVVIQKACFRGGWDDLFDALKYKSDFQSSPLPDWCRLPGGPAAGTVPPPPKPVCDLYVVWYLTGPPGTPVQCQILCLGEPQPGPNWVPFGGSGIPLAAAQSAVESLCGTGPPPLTSVQWYAGCDPAGTAVSWQAGSPSPVGVVGIIGPFADQPTALGAVGTCQPPPPPPPTGTGPGGTTPGVCCDPQTGEIKLPKCIYFDLCDWSKFEDAVFNALCRWAKDPDCQCTFKDHTRYMFEDCDNKFSPAMYDWLGQAGGAVMTSGSVDDLIGQAVQQAVFEPSLYGAGPEPPG